MLRVLVICLLWPCWAAAGPWLKPVGDKFLSTTTSYQRGEKSDLISVISSIYFEAGAFEKLTLGADISYQAGVENTSLLFARTQLWVRDNGRAAVELGLGWHQSNLISEPVYRLGFSWGRGTKTRFGPGWMTVDSHITKYSNRDLNTLKIEGTYGVSSSDKMKWMMQMTVEQYSNSEDVLITLTPSVARLVWGDVFLQIGALTQSAGSQENNFGLKAAIWQNF